MLARQHPNPPLSFEEIGHSAQGPVTWKVTPLNLLIETGGRRATRTREALPDLEGTRELPRLQNQGVALQQEFTAAFAHQPAAGEASALGVAGSALGSLR